MNNGRTYGLVSFGRPAAVGSQFPQVYRSDIEYQKSERIRDFFFWSGFFVCFDDMTCVCVLSTLHSGSKKSEIGLQCTNVRCFITPKSVLYAYRTAFAAALVVVVSNFCHRQSNFRPFTV
jgi:hypothetical protein